MRSISTRCKSWYGIGYIILRNEIGEVADPELAETAGKDEKMPGEGLQKMLKGLKKKFGKEKHTEQELGEVKSMIEKLKGLSTQDKAKVAILALTALGLTAASAAFLVPTIVGTTGWAAAAGVSSAYAGTGALGVTGTFGTYGFLGTNALAAAGYAGAVKFGVAVAGAGSLAGLVKSGQEILKTFNKEEKGKEKYKAFAAKNIAGILPPAPGRVETIPGKAENVSNEANINTRLLNPSSEKSPVPDPSWQEKTKNTQTPKAEKANHQALIIERETYNFNFKPKNKDEERIFDKLNKIKDRVNNDIEILKGKTLKEIEADSELKQTYHVLLAGKKAVQKLSSQLKELESTEKLQKSEAGEKFPTSPEDSGNLEGDINQKFRKIAQMSSEDFKKLQLPKLIVTQKTFERLWDGDTKNAEANEVNGREARNATVLILQEGNKSIAVPNFDSFNDISFNSLHAYYKLPEGASHKDKFELVEPCEVQKQSNGKWKVTKPGKLVIKS
jgi:hypothetical protein